MSLLETKEIQSGYSRAPVLHGVSIRIEPGEMVGVLGANGAGKSTLLKTVAKVLPLSAGQLIFNGADVSKARAHELNAVGLGYVPQDNSVFGELDVLENLQLGGYASKGRWRESLQRVYARFPILEERIHQKASTLSGGERQMLAISCALMVEPKLLMLDEPNSGLAPRTAAEVTESAVRINKHDGVSVLWVIEENPRDVLIHCDRVYFLESGLVVREETGEAMAADPNLEAMFLGRSEA